MRKFFVVFTSQYFRVFEQCANVRQFKIHWCLIELLSDPLLGRSGMSLREQVDINELASVWHTWPVQVIRRNTYLFGVSNLFNMIKNRVSIYLKYNNNDILLFSIYSYFNSNHNTFLAQILFWLDEQEKIHTQYLQYLNV